jgi:hypothetical protein
VHSAPPVAAPAKDNRAAGLLAKLTDLHRAGLLTDAEYEQKRAALEAGHPPR